MDAWKVSEGCRGHLDLGLSNHTHAALPLRQVREREPRERVCARPLDDGV